MELRDKRIVVTGAGGFLGSHMLARLQAAGCRSINAPTSASCNLVDTLQVRALLQEIRPQVIFHLAARVGGIGANARNPGTYFFENIQMGVNIIEEGRRVGVDKIVMVGTICSYPKFSAIPFREDDLWNGYPEETNAPYGIAKKALIVMAEAYRREHGTNAISLLPVNLYGPNDNFDLESSHVIPAIIRKVCEAKLRGEPSVTLWGDGSPTREFLYVEDCAEALFAAATHYDGSEPVNVGAGFEISIRELASMIARIAGFDGRILWDVNRPNGQPRRMLDVTRAKELFGFEAKTKLEDGLARTVAWYQQHVAAG